MNVHRIYITPSLNNNKMRRHNSRGPLFDATYEDKVIVRNSTEPGLDSARELHAMGLVGRLEVWDEVLPYYRFYVDNEKGAALTIQEGEGKPILRKFKSFAGQTALDGFSGSNGSSIPSEIKKRPTNLPPALAGLSDEGNG
jgi:hypothetical protein